MLSGSTFPVFFHLSFFSWAGLYDGRFDNATLNHLVLNEDKFARVRTNVNKCEMIIIDEVSYAIKEGF